MARYGIYLKSSSAQRANFTLATTPFTTGIGQSNNYIPSFPVCTTQSLQHLLWDWRAGRSAVSCSHRCHIQHLIPPCLGLLLTGNLRDDIFVPCTKGFLSKKSFYKGMVNLLMFQVAYKDKPLLVLQRLSYLSLPHFSSSETHHR